MEEQTTELKQIVTYEYQDERGIVRWKKIRDDNKISNKNRRKSYSVLYIDDKGNEIDSWKQVQPPPFNLPKLLNSKTTTVYIVEGEKCAVSLQNLFDANNLIHACVTTFPNGLANKKDLSKYYPLFVDKQEVVICSDNDVPGSTSASLIYRLLILYGLPQDAAKLVDFKKNLNGEESPLTYDVADLLEEIALRTQDVSEQLDLFYKYVQENRRQETSPQNEFSKSIQRRLKMQSGFDLDLF